MRERERERGGRERDQIEMEGRGSREGGREVERERGLDIALYKTDRPATYLWWTAIPKLCNKSLVDVCDIIAAAMTN